MLRTTTTCSDLIIHQTFSNGKRSEFFTDDYFAHQICMCSIELSTLPLRALRPPGWLPQWHCGVRVSSNKKLVGFISAIPADIRIYDT